MVRVCCGYGVEVDEVATRLGEGVGFSRRTWRGFELKASRFFPGPYFSILPAQAFLTPKAMTPGRMLRLTIDLLTDSHLYALSFFFMIFQYSAFTPFP